METRQAIHSAHARTLDTQGLRREFLIPEMFRPGAMTMTYSQIDRIVVGGVMPLTGPVGLPGGIGRTFGVDFFCSVAKWE
jgi:4-deoxy-L-threo-5-hexosulose-uronate ketol-isomerase